MNESKPQDFHQYATVDSINADGSYQVQLNGSLTTTRAAKLCSAEIGDRVMCVVQDGQVAAIGRVGGEPQPNLYEGTITKVYTSYGFIVEQTKFYEYNGVVTVPIQFSTTQNVNFGNGNTFNVASIPADYAPPIQIRVPVFSANLAWNSYAVGWVSISTDGKIYLNGGSSMAAWFGVITYVRG